MEEVEQYGLTEKQIKKLFGDRFFNNFKKWMKGQTVIHIGRKTVYFYWDIQRYAGK